MTGYIADLSCKSGARAIEKLDRLRSTMAVNVLIKSHFYVIRISYRRYRPIIIIIIIIILVITSKQGTYNYIPETNHVSRVHSVAAVLYLQFVLPVMSLRPCNIFCTLTLALSAVCVQCPIWLYFCIFLILCFHVMLLRYCLSVFEIPVAAIITVSILLSYSTCAEFLL